MWLCGDQERSAKGCSALGGDRAQEARQERGECFRLLDIFFFCGKGRELVQCIIIQEVTSSVCCIPSY